jgi:hypothetical protein
MNSNISESIIQMEMNALDRWGKGDPSGFLEISASDVVYFDPYIEKRIDGHEALSNLYDTFRGEITMDSYQMLSPVVQCSNDMAVLTFNLHSHSGNMCLRWNCTEVYRLEPDNHWKIIQTHWSFTKP